MTFGLPFYIKISNPKEFNHTQSMVELLFPFTVCALFLQLALCGLFDYREFDCFVFLVPIGNRKVAGVAFG